MSQDRAKPILHGADHLPGHADPIPGLGGASLPVAARNATGVAITAAADPAPLPFTHALKINLDGAACFAADSNGIQITQSGVYHLLGWLGNGPGGPGLDIQVWIAPSDGFAWASGNSSLLLAHDANYLVPFMPFIWAAQAQQLWAVTEADVPVTAQLWAFSEADGFTTNTADHSLTAIRVGDIGDLPPTGYD